MLTDGDFARATQRIAQDAVRVVGELAVGRQVVRMIEINWVDFAVIDELHELESALGLEANAVEFSLV